MRFVTLAILATTTLASAPSFAQSNTYITAGYDHLHTKKTDTGTLNGRVGYQFSPNIGLEGEGGIGIKEDKVNGVKVRTRGTLGAFGVASIPVGDSLSIFGRAGYVHRWTEAKGDASLLKKQGYKSKDDDGSFAIGVGGQYMLDDSNGVRLDYTRYTKDKGADGITASYVRKF
ncbi:outer membrane beta-barrel protein [Candidatus Phycosocius spiralis]|uniref:Outer membrane protein beta-barrel domain-containing protein n=1 Tax=Candidatus Phycosocius spiralis TaxID=2815099 RepID=A0ABQ4PWK3_9PROT|nr:outer membrane beta-barrel protein [Candidatus Phycosocius spiralis]GIU67421.1 hypothetical protein PsB1_1575 [Candidatus Phycosocius spiralis]